MAKAWMATIKAGRVLRLHLDSGEPRYRQALAQAVRWINDQKLGFRYERTSTRNTAVVIVQAVDGLCLPSPGTPPVDRQGQAPDQLDGASCEGLTTPYDEPGPAGLTCRADVYLPAAPMLQGWLAAPSGGSRQVVRRPAGEMVLTVIAAHELLHAAGLEDKDHTSGLNPDLFAADMAPAGDLHAASDRMQVVGGHGPHAVLPPLRLNDTTRKALSRIWA